MYGIRGAKNGSKSLGGSIKLRKVIISIVIFVPLSGILSVRLTVRMEELGFHRKDRHEIWHLKIKQKNCREEKSFFTI
jgi:hypothetical protein